MNEQTVHVKEKLKQNKRACSVPFLPAENFPKWDSCFYTEGDRYYNFMRDKISRQRAKVTLLSIVRAN